MINFDTDYLQNLTVSAAAIVPIIIGLVQMFKMQTWFKDYYAPFVSLGFGILVSFLLADDFGKNASEIIFTGIIYGLSASGLYSGISTSRKAILMKNQKQQAQEDKSSKPKLEKCDNIDKL